MRAASILFALLCTSTSAIAADWPQYYGPNRDGKSAEKGLMKTWPQEGPQVLWTAPIGIGYGGPAVSAGKVYLLDREDKSGDTLRVFDLATGKELWTFAYEAPGRLDHPGSRSTPAVDGDRVYTIGPLGHLYCISTATQKPVWQKNIWADFGGNTEVPAGFGRPPAGPRPPSPPPAAGAQPRPGGFPGFPADRMPIWGIAQNPLIYRNLLIVAAQAPQAGVVAYDKLSGEVKWKTEPLAGNAGYVTPSFVKVSGEDHLIMITAARGFGRGASGGSVNGLDPLTGKVLWTYTNWQCSIPVPHAVDAGEGRMLITGGYSAGSAMIQVAKKPEGAYEVTELFKNPDFGSHTQPPIFHDGHFYTQYTINERSDGLVCMSLDGKVKWSTGQEPAFVRGGAILADGLLLTTDGRNSLYLVEPNPAAFKPLAKAELLGSGENWAPLALADGKLLIRDHKNLKCVVVGQAAK